MCKAHFAAYGNNIMPEHGEGEWSGPEGLGECNGYIGWA